MSLNEGSIRISSQMVANQKSLGNSCFGVWADFLLKFLEVPLCLNIGSKFSLLVHDPL